MTTFSNLAGREDCDRYIRQELERCGIQVIEGERSDHPDVKTTVTGLLKIGDQEFNFTRLWYYYNVSGMIPIRIANLMYADPVGKTDIRSGGHCGCPAPTEYGSEWLHPDGRQGIPKDQEAELDRFIANDSFEASVKDKYIFTDTPEVDGCASFVRNYHIDSDLGLYIFVQTLERELVTGIPDPMFHRLWTTCVGTEHYDKPAWLSVEKQLRNLGLIKRVE